MKIEKVADEDVPKVGIGNLADDEVGLDLATEIARVDLGHETVVHDDDDRLNLLKLRPKRRPRLKKRRLRSLRPRLLIQPETGWYCRIPPLMSSRPAKMVKTSR